MMWKLKEMQSLLGIIFFSMLLILALADSATMHDHSLSIRIIVTLDPENAHGTILKSSTRVSFFDKARMYSEDLCLIKRATLEVS